MNYLVTAVVFVLIFSVLVLVHELGHFWMAKRAGIKVEEFGFGLPPRLWGKKKGETLYSVNWIPFGGFVRMLGEDASDLTMLKKKRSFMAASMRSRILVVIAGVIMNFLLAWLILTVGFTVGMKPLLGPGDMLTAIDSGIVVLEEGVEIKSVEGGSLAAELGFKGGDAITMFNAENVDVYGFEAALDAKVGIYKVRRDGEIFTFEITPEAVVGHEDELLGFEFNDYAALPRVKVFDVGSDTPYYNAGLRAGDIILTLNDKHVFYVDEYEKAVRGQSLLNYEVYRNGLLEQFVLELPQSRKVVVDHVIADSPAANANIKEGDVILSINGKQIYDSEEMIAYVASAEDKAMAYMIERAGNMMFLEIKPENGMIGVLISELMDYSQMQDISLYNHDLVSSLKEIKDVKYPFYTAVYKSFGEIVRISRVTADMFVVMVGGLIIGDEVPHGVAGPVGIAQLTHVFVQEGIMSVLRLTAILSLSLAVINILPFPALDGGRLLFLLFEMIAGKKVNYKFEAYVHAIGYLLILLLIVVITYSDILRLLRG